MNRSPFPTKEFDILPGIENVLVTGASGFIGRHLVARLKEIGKNVVSVSRGEGVDVTCDPLPLDGVGHVFHAAGRIGVPDSWREPLSFLEANTVGTAHVLEQCRTHGCGMTFVGAYIYGIPEHLPIAEGDPVKANNPYALSKFLAEQMCSFFAEHFGVRAVILRLFNIYGAGQDERMLIPFIVRQILDPACAMVEVMDLNPKRDYVHVADVVDALLLSTRAEPGAIFNVGSGEAISVEEVIQRAARIAGVDKPYRDKASRRHNEIDSTVADISHIREAIGWRPRISFDQGLGDVIRDMRKQCAA
jgi:nucleoside-diphosphate-sugar epimerase